MRDGRAGQETHGLRKEGAGIAKRRKDEFDPEQADSMTAEEIEAFLDRREALFVREHLKDLNGTQAAIRAGYRPGKNNASAAVQASRLLREERIRAYRRALIRESAEDMELTRESMALKLLEIYRRCMAAEPVMGWNSEEKAWVESGVWRFDARGAARALEQLTRLLGLDAPQQHEVSGTGLEGVLKLLEGERTW